MRTKSYFYMTTSFNVLYHGSGVAYDFIILMRRNNPKLYCREGIFSSGIE
jgi:hypothetical protein